MHKSTFFACADASSNEVLRLPGRGSGLAPAATPGFRSRPQPVTCAVSRRYSQSNVASPEPRALRRAGLGVEVDAVLAANPSARTTVVPPAAQNLLDELTVWGDAPAARTPLHGWYDDGADEPVLVLPPGRPIEEFDYAPEALRPH
jgi:hypothetical protein